MVNVLLKYMIIFWPNGPYYAGIMLDAFSYLLCSKLCWHNRLVPNHCMILLYMISIVDGQYQCNKFWHTQGYGIARYFYTLTKFICRGHTGYGDLCKVHLCELQLIKV